MHCTTSEKIKLFIYFSYPNIRLEWLWKVTKSRPLMSIETGFLQNASRSYHCTEPLISVVAC